MTLPLPGLSATPHAYGSHPMPATLEPDAGAPPPQFDGAGAGGKWDWSERPRGLLVTTLREHSGQINAIAVAQDHSFFASACDDGTLRLWPSSHMGRLEVVPGAHTVYKQQVRVCI